MLFGASSAMAQGIGNSPYSRFGLGDRVDENFMHSRAMGSLGNSYLNGYHINIVNPASYATLRATSFELGMGAKRSYLESGDLTHNQWGGNLEYISLGFPLKNPLNSLLDKEKSPYNLAMAFTLMPNSTVNYNITSTETIDNLGEVERNYTGEGGSYKFLWGNSIKYKDLSFGLNLGYLFGRLEYSRNIDFLELQAPYQDRFLAEYNLNGFLWGVGAIYSKVLNQDKLDVKIDREAKVLSIGATLKASTGFNTTLTTGQFGVQTITSSLQYIDTVSITQDVKGSGKLPLEYGLGVSYYGGEKYMVGIDLAAANWSNYRNDADLTAEDNPLSNTFSVSLGGYYRPNYKSFTNYFKRVYYQYGFYYKTDPLKVEGEQLKNYGLTAGVGLPFVYQRKVSHANLGIDLGIRGSGSPISEKYIKLTFGFTFNDDEWFIKRKYN